MDEKTVISTTLITKQEIQCVEEDERMDTSENFNSNSTDSTVILENESNTKVSTKISLEDYLKQISSPEVKNVKGKNIYPEEECINVSSPEDILKKYYKPPQKIELDFSKMFIDSEPMPLLEIQGSSVPQEKSSASSSMCNTLDTDSNDLIPYIHDTPENRKLVQENRPGSNYIHTEDLALTSNKTNQDIYQNFETIFRQKIIENFKNMEQPDTLSEDDCYQKALHSFPNIQQITEQIPTNKFTTILSKYFDIWRHYNKEIIHFLSNILCLDTTELLQFHENFKEQWLNLKTLDEDVELKNILKSKLEETYIMIKKQLEIDEECIEYAIGIAKKYYRHDMISQKKILYGFVHACEFSNQTQLNFYVKKLTAEFKLIQQQFENTKIEKQTIQITQNKPASNIQTIQNSPTVEIQTESKEPSVETVQFYSKVLSNCYQFYQNEMDREMQVINIQETTQVDQVHEMSQQNSLNKFKRLTANQLNEVLFEMKQQELITKINESYLSYKKIVELKQENLKSQHFLLPVAVVQTSQSSSKILNVPLVKLVLSNFIGIHIGLQSLSVGYIINNNFTKFQNKILENIDVANFFSVSETITQAKLISYIQKIKTLCERSILHTFDSCVITIPICLTSVQEENLKNGAQGAGFTEVITIYETCAAAFDFLQKQPKTERLVVLHCDKNLWSAEAYSYNQNKKSIHLCSRLGNFETKNSNDFERAKQIIKDVKDEAKFSVWDTLLVGNRTTIVNMKQKGFGYKGKVSIEYPECILQGCVQYAVEMFDKRIESRIRISYDSFNSKSVTLAKKESWWLTCSIL